MFACRGVCFRVCCVVTIKTRENTHKTVLRINCSVHVLTAPALALALVVTTQQVIAR